MHVVGVVGPADERDAAVERVVARLADRGTVGVVADRDGGDVGAEYREAGAAVAHGLGGDGWVAAGPERSLDAVLDDLAVDCDYAVVAGHPDADVPAVALGDAEAAGDVIERAPDAASVDVAAVADALADRQPRETLESLVRRAKADADSEFAGAIATFTGRVRPREDPDDDYTRHLEFERYDGVAEERMAAIRSELEAREGVYRVLLYHKTGVVEAEEDIVHVVVLAGHRAEAFETVEDGIDRLKAEVPLFKREVTVEDAFWAHRR